MPRITLEWPEEGISEAINTEELWKISEFKKIGSNQVVAAEFPDTNGLTRLVVSEVIVRGHVCSFMHFDELLQRCSFDQDITIKIRSMQPWYFFPSDFNGPIAPESFCYLNIFFIYNGKCKYKSTKYCCLDDLKKIIATILEASNFSSIDYEVIYCVAKGRKILATDAGLTSIINNGKHFMNIVVKPEKSIVYYMGEGTDSKEIRIDYLPLIPKVLLSAGLKHLKTGDEVQQAIKRRLVRLTSNSIVPLHLLSKINELNLDVNQLQRATLPLSSWRDHINSVTSNLLAQDALTCACLYINQDISEATLRLRVWDALIKAFVSDNALLESEYHLEKILNFSNIVKADLALVIKNIKIPALVIEIGKELPCGGFENKDFVKIETVLGRSCLKLAENFLRRGQNPLEAKTFGSLIGYTSFKFLVATPQIYLNQKYGREEIFINLSFYDHWKMDLITSTAGTDCSSDCCRASVSGISLPTIQTNLEHLVPSDNLEVSLDEPLGDQAEPVENILSSNMVVEDIIEVPLDEQTEAEEVQQDQAEQVVQEQQDEFVYNMEAVCKLKIFIECANQAAAHFETLLNLPVLPDAAEADGRIHFPSTEPLIEKSSSKTPSSKKVRFAENPHTNGIGNSASLRTGKLQKPASREIDVYRAIPAHYKIFFPLLHDFQIDPEDPKNHIFIIESLKPLLLESNRLGTVFRTGSLCKLILEAATFAVHILFDLFILHEKVGWVHADVSPNNIMFSERLGIWKLIDFDLSLPIEESLKTPRRAGTRDFKAPESIRTKIWTQASDVFALGKVIQYVFGDEMRRFNVTGNHVDFQAFNQFNQLINNMCSDNVNQRSSVRVALKSWIDFVFKYEVKEFQIYGYNLIFPLAIEELKNSPNSLSTASSFTRTYIY